MCVCVEQYLTAPSVKNRQRLSRQRSCHQHNIPRPRFTSTEGIKSSSKLLILVLSAMMSQSMSDQFVQVDGVDMWVGFGGREGKPRLVCRPPSRQQCQKQYPMQTSKKILTDYEMAALGTVYQQNQPAITNSAHRVLFADECAGGQCSLAPSQQRVLIA